MNPIQEYDFKVMSEIHPVPKLIANIPEGVSNMYIPKKQMEGFQFDMPYPFPRPKGWRYMDIAYGFPDNWTKLRDLEEKINKLINKIFQENPSLP